MCERGYERGEPRGGGREPRCSGEVVVRRDMDFILRDLKMCILALISAGTAKTHLRFLRVFILDRFLAQSLHLGDARREPPTGFDLVLLAIQP